MAFYAGDIWNLKPVVLIFNLDADLQIDISANWSWSVKLVQFNVTLQEKALNQSSDNARVDNLGRLVGLQLILNLLSAHWGLMLIMIYKTGAEIITTSSDWSELQLYLGVVMSQLWGSCNYLYISPSPDTNMKLASAGYMQSRAYPRTV